MNQSKPLSKSKRSCCYYCGKSMLDNSLALHCKEVHNKPKRVAGQTLLSFASGSDRNEQENQSKPDSLPPSSLPPVSSDDDRCLSLPGVENRREKRSRTEFSEVASSADYTSDTTSQSVVNEKLDLILTQLSNLDLKITTSASYSLLL